MSDYRCKIKALVSFLGKLTNNLLYRGLLGPIIYHTSVVIFVVIEFISRVYPFFFLSFKLFQITLSDIPWNDE